MSVFRMPTMHDFAQALERAARAAVVAAVALYPAQSILDNVTGTQPIDVDLAKKAATAGIIAGIAFLWRFLLPDLGRSKPAAVAFIPAGAETASHVTPDAATDA